MRNTIIHLENNGRRIIGNVNIFLSDFAEVQIISPYFGFILQGNRCATNEKSGQPEASLEEVILQRSYDLCRILQERHQEIRTDFLTLTETLEKFNNRNTEDYHRNRNELMKVFMNRFFQTTEESNVNYLFERDAVFNFLAHYFIKNGKASELRITTLYATYIPPPAFTDLEHLLKDYLTKTESEKMELLAEKILSKKNGKYDWFIQQEFLTENINNHEII